MNRGGNNKRSPGSKSGKNTVVVAVRVRPLTSYEIDIDSSHIVSVKNEKVVMIHDPKTKENLNDPLYRTKESKYAFDLALDTESTNRELYDRAVQPVVQSVMRGRPGTVFAYGATGHGKTFTMSGSGPHNPGIMYYTISDLFNAIESQSKRVLVTASYLEIYNETLIDLLSDVPTTLDIREDRQRGITVSGVTEYKMENATNVFDILAKGAENRTTDSHVLNDASSRSHAVLMITVAQLSNNGDRVTKSANLTMIDLAGSERAKKTGTDKKTLREAAKINRSLLSLANCINALASQKKGLYIPYRDSKLTRLLKESLGGGAHTVMIANISSASTQFDEVRETLLYANRAKNIKVTRAMEKEYDRVSKVVHHTTQQDHIYAKLVSDIQNDLYDLKDSLTPNRALPMQLSLSMSSPKPTHITPPPSSPQQRLQLPPSELLVSSNSADTTAAVAVAATAASTRTKPRLVPQLSKTTTLWNTTQRIVERIVSNFQDRIQIRRSLVELNEVDHTNQQELHACDNQLSTVAGTMSTQQLQQLRSDRESILATINDNAEYRRRQTDELHELKVEGAQLRRTLDAQGPLNEERELIVHLTLDRCVLELQKMDMELNDHSQKRTLHLKQAECEYYQRLLQQSGVMYSVFDPSVVVASETALPAAPDLLSLSPGTVDPRIRAALATPTDNDKATNEGGSRGFTFAHHTQSTPCVVVTEPTNTSSPVPVTTAAAAVAAAAASPTPKKVPTGALRALKTKMKKRQSRGMPKSYSAMDISHTNAHAAVPNTARAR